MGTKTSHLRASVLMWTILTTTFFWTSTMRMLMKPEISNWRIFNIGGKGFMGDFWFPPLIVVFALFLFYLEGRGKFRFLFQILLVGWHFFSTGVIVYGSLQSSSRISFNTWGIHLSLGWLVVPFAVFTVLSIILVIQEYRGKVLVPVFEWTGINRKKLGIAILLFPVGFLLFRSGKGFDLMVKSAVFVTIVQWIILTEALGRPHPKETGNAGDTITSG